MYYYYYYHIITGSCWKEHKISRMDHRDSYQPYEAQKAGKVVTLLNGHRSMDIFRWTWLNNIPNQT